MPKYRHRALFLPTALTKLEQQGCGLIDTGLLVDDGCIYCDYYFGDCLICLAYFGPLTFIGVNFLAVWGLHLVLCALGLCA